MRLGSPLPQQRGRLRVVAAAGEAPARRHTSFIAFDRRAMQHIKRGCIGCVSPVPGCFGAAVVGSFDADTTGATRYPCQRVGCLVGFVAFRRAGDSCRVEGCLSGQQRQLI